MAEEFKTRDGEGGALDLDTLDIAVGMDPIAKIVLQQPDKNYLQEVAKLPVSLGSAPSGTDVKAMRKWVKETFEEGPLPEYRNNFDIKRRRPKQDIQRRIISVPCSDGSDTFKLWIYEPTAKPTISRPALLMFHGGGWIHGDPGADDAVAKIFASELDAVVLGVDYRLAPENPYPASLNDSSSALYWVLRNSGGYNIDTTRIGLWGASAGANLAAALALQYSQQQRTSDHPSLKFVSLVVPVVGTAKVFASFENTRPFPKSRGELMFEGAPDPPESFLQDLEKLYDLYTGGKTDPSREPLLSPLLATSFSDHPATRITVAACDHLRAQGQAYAELLRQSGVHVTEQVLPGVPHMFNLATSAEVHKTWLVGQIDLFAKAFAASTLAEADSNKP